MHEAEVIGYDDDEEVGVTIPFSTFRALRGRLGRAIAKPPASWKAPQAQPRTLGRRVIATKQRRRYLPLGQVTLAAGADGQLQVTVQGPIQGERLILEANSPAGEVTVENIRVGTRSQLEGTEAMPVEAFARDATGSALRLDPATTGVQVTIDLNNAGAAAAIVSGVLIGVTGY